ncbi:LOW QUALITY PROTEIN: putative RNA polymerase II subunit B1 CTD phosphatase rpap2 [Etheostoma spectabile]|uniref:LOW QUALITY PROTEIN: putative RNA polymerase II subunit B1 CTD phosphatase rpap2 n=1 Tax=Etheostoma spectabile TaxID=54343 RepID=UPI0013AFAF03|nr:LOW QUALITY PROTEIN: putative RNA polymerase II subunit B1 CTD phosphatase RPAP2 [Etheostoma spectabile]
METEERRRSQGSDKTSKKGGKRIKALAAEEEARRRAVVTEMLRDKLDLERRALKIVERLLEDSVAEDFLVDCARFITPANYKDALEERSIAKLCGYPICSNELGKIPTQKYRISTKTNKVYDITERKCFCSDFCYKASKEFELQIPNTPLWLRQHESPQEIKLMKKRDGGSSGEEVKLLERRLQVDDIEDPLAAPPEDPPSSRPGSAADGLSRSESSDVEEEQDFVSSVVSQRQGPRVHWGDLPKHTDEGDRGMMERQKKQGREEGIEGQAAEREGKKGEDKKDSLSCETEVGTDAEKKLNSNTDRPHGEPVPDQQSVEEATAKLNLCSLSESVAQPAPPPVDSTATQAEHTNRITSPLCKDSNSSTERKHLPASTLIKTIQDGHDTASSSQPALNITQVGVSKRGAAGLQDLLKGHAARTKPHSIRLNLLECLRSTLKDWSTDKTLEFLYGAHYSLGCPVVDIKEEKEAGEEDEELDEDDLEDDVTNEDAQWVGAGGQKRASAAVPDYQALRQETQHLELRVREFYKGTWILPEEAEELHGNQVTVQDQNTQDPALPLVDSQAQHLIQKRITVEKLTSSLRNIVGPLSLTISDFSTDLNNLVKTFRFSNTNIIHKTAEWTLIAVVLLHLLSEVSPVVREALETPASAEYLNTLMEELGLQEQDLLNIVRLFKAPAQ